MLDGQDSWDRLSLTLRNCTLWGNRATQRGNAICNLRGVVSIESSTITGNVGSAPSALWASGTINQPAQFQLHNSIAAGNGTRDIDGSGADVTGIPHYYAYPFISDGFNLIGTGGSGDGSTSAFDKTGDAVIGNGSPGLGPLQDNGGRTFTHAVLLGSPALNTGSSSLGTDQRGLSRALGGVRDKGAYELQPETYAFWSGHTFPFGTPAPLLAPGADYDGDGILNGIEHATGRNPLVPDLGGAVTLFQIQGANLVLQFERSILVDPAKISIEQSLDLATWTTLGITLQNLGPATPTTELIQALIPTGGAPRKFGRLRYGP